MAPKRKSKAPDIVKNSPPTPSVKTLNRKSTKERGNEIANDESENKTSDRDKNAEFFSNPKTVTTSDYLNSPIVSEIINNNPKPILNYYISCDEVRAKFEPPPIETFKILPQNRGIAAVDVCQDLSYMAFSLLHSHEVHLCARNSFSDDMARNDLFSTNFISARNDFNKSEKSGNSATEYLASPQHYTYKYKDKITAVRFASDNSILMSCSLDGSAKAVNTINHRVVESYIGYGSFTDIDVNSKVTQFATANTLSTTPFHAAYLYKLERREPVKMCIGHKNSIKCIRFHPNGLYFATAAGKTIRLWSHTQNKEVRIFKDGNSAQQITFSPDGKYIASAYSAYLKIWDLASEKEVSCLKLSNTDFSNVKLCYNLDSSILAAGGLDKKIHFWRVTSDESSKKLPEFEFLKSMHIGRSIFSIKYDVNLLSCFTD